MKKVLLVCAADCSELQERLIRAGCSTVRANTGAEAILRAKHETIDTALLVSTGKEMDVAETALNLSDINSSLDIVIIEQKHSEHRTADTDAIRHAIPQARILTAQEFGHYLRQARAEDARIKG